MLDAGVATLERVVVSDAEPTLAGARRLTVPLMTAGQADHAFVGVAGVRAAREHHAAVVRELAPEGTRLSPGDPAIATDLG